jgi:hypothetical protein
MTTDNQNLMTAAEESSSSSDSAQQQSAENQDVRNAASKNSGSKDGTGENSVLAQKDQTINALRQQISRNALQAQIDRIETEAAKEAAADIAAVSDGEMTAEQAQTRADDRRNATRDKVTKAENAPDPEAIATNQLVNDALVAREGFAVRLGREFSVDIDALMDDQTLTNPDEMRAKAQELAQEAEKNRTGSQTFDAGQRRAASLDVNDMDAMSKVRAGLA